MRYEIQCVYIYAYGYMSTYTSSSGTADAMRLCDQMRLAPLLVLCYYLRYVPIIIYKKKKKLIIIIIILVL